jgi:hypothetical protein
MFTNKFPGPGDKTQIKIYKPEMSPSALEASDSKANLNYRESVTKVKNRLFMALGYGLNAYFDTLTNFILLMFIMTLVSMGFMLTYSSFDGMKNLGNKSITGLLSFGNLGSS